MDFRPRVKMYLEACDDILKAKCDVVIFINDDIPSLGESFTPIEKVLKEFNEVCVLLVHQARYFKCFIYSKVFLFSD